MAHAVIARELGRATSRGLGTENARQGGIGLKGAARTRGLQFCRTSLYAHATPSGVSAQIAERHARKDLCNWRRAPPSRLRCSRRLGGEIEGKAFREGARPACQGTRSRRIPCMLVGSSANRTRRKIPAMTRGHQFRSGPTTWWPPCTLLSIRTFSSVKRSSLWLTAELAELLVCLRRSAISPGCSVDGLSAQNTIILLNN